MKSNLIIFQCLRVYISFLKRGPIGFSAGIDSTKVSLSEIIHTFPRPSGRRRENGAKHHPKMISAKFEINIFFLTRDKMGFSVGIDSTKSWLSEIIYTFPRPLGRRW